MATPVAATATGTSDTWAMTSRVPVIDAPAADPARDPLSRARSVQVPLSDGPPGGRGAAESSLWPAVLVPAVLRRAGTSAAAFRGRLWAGCFRPALCDERDEVMSDTLREIRLANGVVAVRYRSLSATTGAGPSVPWSRSRRRAEKSERRAGSTGPNFVNPNGGMSMNADSTGPPRRGRPAPARAATRRPQPARATPHALRRRCRPGRARSDP
jgi:hypothetical protein